MKLHYSIEIARPPQAVFAFIANLDNERRWQPEIESVRVLTAGPFGLGSEFEEVRRTFGRRYTWRFRVTEFEPPRRFSIESIQGTTRYIGSRLCEPVAGGTRFSEIGEIETPKLLRPFDPLLARLALRPQRIAFNQLKALLLQSVVEPGH
jgi:hypothetical protein